MMKVWLTPLIAIIAAYIAWQQWKTNRQTFRFKRYDRYLEVYRATQDFLKAALNGHTSGEERLRYENATFDSDFLFDEDLAPYLEEIYDRVRGLDYWREEYDALTNELPTEHAHDEICTNKATCTKWILDQRKKYAKLKFMKYLDLTDHTCLNAPRRYGRRVRNWLSERKKNRK
jgi:hypothetical protein